MKYGNGERNYTRVRIASWITLVGTPNLARTITYRQIPREYALTARSREDINFFSNLARTVTYSPISREQTLIVRSQENERLKSAPARIDTYVRSREKRYSLLQSGMSHESARTPGSVVKHHGFQYPGPGSRQ